MCGRGKIRTQYIDVTWAQIEEMEGPILLSVLTQYIDVNPRDEAEEFDRLRSLKSERSLKGFKQAT